MTDPKNQISAHKCQLSPKSFFSKNWGAKKKTPCLTRPMISFPLFLLGGSSNLKKPKEGTRTVEIETVDQRRLGKDDDETNRGVTTCITGGFVFSGFPPLNFHINTQNKAFLKLEIYLSTHYFWFGIYGVYGPGKPRKTQNQCHPTKRGWWLTSSKKIFCSRNLWIRINIEIVYLTLGGWWKEIQLILGSNFPHISSWKMIHFRLGAGAFRGLSLALALRERTFCLPKGLRMLRRCSSWNKLIRCLFDVHEKWWFFSELSWTFLPEKRPSKAKVSGNVFLRTNSGHFWGRCYSWK